jgi:hypothetical protein
MAMAGRNIVRAAFDQGQIPTVACFSNATIPLGVDLEALVATLQKFVETCFAPIWGTHAKLVKAKSFVPGAWALAFLDTADVAGALGYHDLTPDGLPLAKVFVKTTIKDRQKVSVTACHELAEMLVDPAINLWSDNMNGVLYAYETADAVEETEFELDGIAMSDFVYPAYFEAFRKPNSAQFDYCKKVARPFQVLSGGYSIINKGGKVTQIYGSKAKAKRFKKEIRTGHRSEFRRYGLPKVRSKLK